jgi:hypothetical protein
MTSSILVHVAFAKDTSMRSNVIQDGMLMGVAGIIRMFIAANAGP